jgi:wyosine [tRNA(Phe)-imidazoG37] synthetase (radical SAM superfamily)
MQRRVTTARSTASSQKPKKMIAFGPVPSRRLGQSLGINNIPPKTCSYDCVYCQVGPTPTARKKLDRRSFYSPEEIFAAVQKRVREVLASGDRIDYLTLVPDGEPTLDIHLGRTIELLRPLGIRMAVISNASLISRADVREELMLADYVSLKIDSVDEQAWRKINRPHPELSLSEILDGALLFAQAFRGTLTTETMLVRGINDHEASLKATAAYLGQLDPDVAYICVPTRPPSEKWAHSPDEQAVNLAFQLFSPAVRKAECLTGYSPEAFSATGDVIRNLLNITAVHPMRESEALALLKEKGIEGAKLQELVDREELVRVIHDGLPFYVRKLPLVGSDN